MQLTDASKDLYTGTRTKELQDHYGIKYDELWDEDRLEELLVSKEHIKEIVKIRGKELAYKDTVGFELGEGVVQSERFKKLQDFYGITIEDTQSEDTLKSKGVNESDIAFITGKRIKSKKKAIESNKQEDDTKAKGDTKKSTKTAK